MTPCLGYTSLLEYAAHWDLVCERVEYSALDVREIHLRSTRYVDDASTGRQAVRVLGPASVIVAWKRGVIHVSAEYVSAEYATWHRPEVRTLDDVFLWISTHYISKGDLPLCHFIVLHQTSHGRAVPSCPPRTRE